MAGREGLTVLFTLLGALLLGAGAQETKLTVLKLAGSEVIMKPNYVGTPSEINWKLNGNKLVDMELNSPAPPMFYRLRDRASIDRTNGELTIRNLTLGDFGLYRAEVLVNNLYQITEITLTVRACPDVPRITDNTTKENIDLHCESSTPGVTYEWFNQTKSVGKDQLYSGPRPKKDVNLTCVVDNEVCKKNSSIIISYIPDHRGHHEWIVALIIVVLVILGVIAVLYHRERNATDVEGRPSLTESQQVKRVGSDVTLEPQCSGDPSQITWKMGNGNKLVDMILNSLDEPIFEHLQDRASIDRTNGVLTIRDLTIEDSGVYRAEAKVKNGHQNTEITLTVRERCSCITVKFQTKDQLKGNVKQCLTIHNVKPEDHDRYVLEVLQSDGEKHTFNIKETDDIVIIRIEDDKVTLTVPDTEKVTKMTWKKGGVTLFQWAVSGLKLHTNNITLKPGFVTVNNAGGEGSYKVALHSTDNRITNNTLQLEANNEGNESPTNGKEESEEVEMALLPERDLPEPIGSVTFHPISVTNKFSLKKDGEAVNIDNDRLQLSPNGDLRINNVTSVDEGKYTVRCEDQKQEQEFTLCL